MKIYKTAIYLRLSSGGGRDFEEDSITNQRNVIENYLKDFPEFEIDFEFIDDGISGLTFERPEFIKMIEKCKNVEINCIIVRDLSRFGRDYIQTGQYLQINLPLMGIRFISIFDDIDSEKMDENKELMLKLKLIINDAFSHDISKKTRASLKNMRENGLYVSPFSFYGYKKSDFNRHKLEIDENTAPVVREIFDLNLRGYSLNKIANILNKNNILSPLLYKKTYIPTYSVNFPTTDTPKWYASTVRKVLANEIYTGTLIQGKLSNISYKLKIPVKQDGFRVFNTHEAIISKNDFDLVQKELSLKGRAVFNDKSHFLLSGFVFCGCCGGKMTIKTVYSNLTYNCHIL